MDKTVAMTIVTIAYSLWPPAIASCHVHTSHLTLIDCA